jgi:nucleotide-binding universal stress UspA family protein
MGNPQASRPRDFVTVPGARTMYSRILVPIDGSEPSECGLRQAIDIASSCGATLVILHVVAQLPLMMGAAGYVNYGEMTELLTRSGHELVEKAAKRAADAGVECESVVVDGGVSPVCDTIV